eukprot:8149467-Heterocapsa_arctica.AAC.2
MPLVGLPLVPLPGSARNPVENPDLVARLRQMPLHLPLKRLEDGVLEPLNVAREANGEEVVS